MLAQGVVFMVVGMTTVFFFLSIMVLMMKLMSLLVKFFPEPEVLETKKVISQKASGFDEIAVVLASCKKYMTK